MLKGYNERQFSKLSRAANIFSYFLEQRHFLIGFAIGVSYHHFEQIMRGKFPFLGEIFGIISA
jgi:hypothetical protein